MKLPPKQQLFIKEYLIDLNATQAAIKAGYSKKTARSAGQRLLTKVDISDAIQKGMDKRGEKIDIDAEYVLTKIKDAVERCSAEDTYEANALLRGCELLGKHLELFTDKVKHSGKVDWEQVSDEDLERKYRLLVDEQSAEDRTH